MAAAAVKKIYSSVRKKVGTEKRVTALVNPNV
jgi:hypothetical protein